MCWRIGEGGWFVVSIVIDFLVCCLERFWYVCGWVYVGLLRVAIVFAVFVVWLSFAVLCWFGGCCLRLWCGSSCCV